MKSVVLLVCAYKAYGITHRIADPEATKPDDWDEDAPRMIEDDEAEKPEGWLDDEAAEIDDPGTPEPLILHFLVEYLSYKSNIFHRQLGLTSLKVVHAMVCPSLVKCCASEKLCPACVINTML